MTTEDAKTYLSKRDIPRLFESLMTGLMYHRPSDHIKYLIDCLHKVHDKGQDNITWSSFVDIRRTKTPLPPISNGQARPASKGGSRPSSKTRPPKEEAPKREKTSSPLPAIPTSRPEPEKVNLPDIPVVFVMGAPGSGKERQVDQLLKRYAGWKHLSVGKVIKQEITRRGDAHTKWKLTRDLLSKGEAAPEEVSIDCLVDSLKESCSTAKGIVITGFPRNMSQVGDYTKCVSRVDAVFLIDCEESKAMDKMLRKGRNSSRPEHSMSAITNRMNYFKAHTLETAKYYDDQGKLVVIEGDADDDNVRYNLAQKFDDMFYKKYGTSPAEAKRPGTGQSLPEPATYKKKHEVEREESDLGEEPPLFTGGVPQPPVIEEKDTGRKPDLPTVPIVFIAGGPGSGKGTQCARIVKRYPDFVHLSMGDIIRGQISTQGTSDQKWGMIAQLVSKGEMAPEEVTVDLLKAELKKHTSAKAFIVEGFPRDKKQVEAFNKSIGGLNFVILFDCEEYYMQTRLLKRGRESGRVDDNPTAIANRLNFYKYNTLPIMKTFDDDGKLVVLDADRDIEEMFFDISQMFDFAFFGRKPGEQTNTATYLTEPKSSDGNEAKLQIRAAFSANRTRQKKILTRGASYTRKYDTTTSAKSGKPVANTQEKSGSKSYDPKAQIQAGFAAKKVREEAKVKKEKAKAKDRIAAGFRALKIRKERSKIEKVQESESKTADDKMPDDTDVAEAALRIQAGFRGYRARQEVEKLKEQKQQLQTTPEKTDVTEMTPEEAALRIHAGMQGYITRKQLKQQKEEKDKKAEEVPVREEVVEETITTQIATTTGNTIDNPAHSQKLEDSAK